MRTLCLTHAHALSHMRTLSHTWSQPQLMSLVENLAEHRVLISRCVYSPPCPTTHAQTETAAWGANSICVVPAGYPKLAIPY